MEEPRKVNPKCRSECPKEWPEWSNWLAPGLHGRVRWRFSVLPVDILFASGRRTVTTWLRAAGVTDDQRRLATPAENVPPGSKPRDIGRLK